MCSRLNRSATGNNAASGTLDAVSLLSADEERHPGIFELYSVDIPLSRMSFDVESMQVLRAGSSRGFQH